MKLQPPSQLRASGRLVWLTALMLIIQPLPLLRAEPRNQTPRGAAPESLRRAPEGHRPSAHRAAKPRETAHRTAEMRETAHRAAEMRETAHRAAGPRETEHWAAGPRETEHRAAGPRKADQSLERYGKPPVSFEANRGQFDSRIKFISRQRGFTLSLTPGEAAIGAVRMRMLGANRDARISGLDQLPGKLSYFLGDDPKHWRTDAPTFGKVKYEAIYPGIDLLFHGDRQQIEYDFVVAPNADPNAIRLDFKGARRLRLDANGDLVVETNAGVMRQRKPFVYQETNGVKREIASRYIVKGNRVGFALGAYDRSQPLVIDPVLSYSTFLGGAQSDNGEAIAVDAEGNAYVTGRTALIAGMTDPFPTTPGAPQPSGDFHGDYYVFVTKLNAAGSGLVYSAIIGGTRPIRHVDDRGREEYLFNNIGRGIAVDAGGNVYVTGSTHTANFPTTPGAIQAQTAITKPVNEAFVFKLNASGNALVYSTLLGQGNANGNALAVDAQGQAWMTGGTGARNFPVTPNAFQRAPKNTGSAVFVSKLNATGTALLYSTFLSSGSGESGLSIALDAGGGAYVSGTTGSSCNRAGDLPVEPFPTTEGAFRRDLGEGCPATGSLNYVFVTRFAADGAVVYSTLLGVSSGGSIAADAEGNAYVAGLTFKRYDFPTTPGAFQTEIIGPSSMPAGFVVKLNPQGSALVYSTFINGASGGRMAIDRTGAAYVTGALSAFTFIRTTTDPPFDAIRGVFVTKLNPQGSALGYSVILGEGNGKGIAVDARGDAYVTGETNSDDFRTTPGAFQPQRRNAAPHLTDGFVAKISEPRIATHVSAANYAAPLAADSIIAAFGSGLAMTTQAAAAQPLPMTLAGTKVKVRDSAGAEREAPLFFVSPAQVNYLLPAGAASGQATITITSGDGAVSTANARIEAVAPGLFSADASGRGVAAAVALRVRANGEQSYEPVARYDAARQQMVAAPIDLGEESDQVFLILYGTGWRHRSNLSGANVRIGGVDAQVLFAGEQGGFFGLDQINVRLPRSLAGRGDVEIVLSVDGRVANAVNVRIK